MIQGFIKFSILSYARGTLLMCTLLLPGALDSYITPYSMVSIWVFPEFNISPRVQEYIPGFLLTLLITSTFFFKGLLVGALEITPYSNWNTKIHCQQFDSHVPV